MREMLRFLLAPFRAGICCLFGGDSDSSQTSNQFDKRVTGRDGAQISGDNNTVHVTATDYGAVMAGQETARAALVAGTVATLSAADVFDRAIAGDRNLVDKAIGAFGSAYETAKAGDQREVSMVAMAAVAIVAAVSLFGKRL